MLYSIKNKLVKKLLIIVILSASVFISSLSGDSGSLEVRALFSWNQEQVLEEREELFKIMEKLGNNTLYQEFPKVLKQKEIDSFLIEAEDKKINVSFLAGDPKWGLDKDGKEMLGAVDRVIEINKNIEKSNGIKSIIFDVEPYLSDEWNKNTDNSIMNSFVKAITTAYKKANENSIEVIVCIPYYYDDMGFSRQLKRIIKSGCDSVAIMSYYKDNEAKHINKEVKYADKYRKKIINIYELQAAGKYGLEDKNTYYKEGIVGVEKSFANIKEEFVGKDVSIAFHEYNVVKEILKR